VTEKNKFIIRIEGERYGIDSFANGSGEILYELVEFLIRSQIIVNDEQVKKNIYKFNFVGIITYKEIVIVVLPKFYYKLNLKPEVNIETIKSELVQTIRVLRKYSKSREIETSSLEFIDLNGANNEIALADFILFDFVKNGFINIKKKNEGISKNTAICWPKTIEKFEPVFSNGTPIYIDHINYHTKINEVFIYIHKKAILYCANRYSNILGYNIRAETRNSDYINIKDKDIEILLRNQLMITYRDREKQLLRILYMLWKNIQNQSNTNNIHLYGVRSFHVVWEKICKFIFNSEDELKGYIENPRWFSLSPFVFGNADKSLIPDVLRRFGDNFFILDAKYRNFRYNKNIDYINKQHTLALANYPGIEEVLKQIAYKFTFEKKKSELGVRKISNIFLFPKLTTSNAILHVVGGVSLYFIKNLEDEYVVNVYVSASNALDMYINDKRLSEDEIKDFIRKLTLFENEYTNSRTEKKS
jgi:hypothetical protein